MKGHAELPLSGFDEKPKPGMRCLNKIRELFRKIIRDKVTFLSTFLNIKTIK